MNFVRGIDHAVITAHDLGALAALWQRLGFQVSSQNAHPWGTRNHIIQLENHFIELIGAGDAAATSPRPYFADHLLAFLAQHQGMAMLALTGINAAADAAAFAEARMSAAPVFAFSRPGLGADGTVREVAFDLAFATSPLLSAASFFTCHHRHPENFWAPAQQVHPNGVRALASVMMIAEDPADHAEFLSTVTGQREMLATSFGLDLRLGVAHLEVMSPAAWHYTSGLAAIAKPVRFVGLRLVAPDLPALAARLIKENIPFTRHDNRLVITPETAFGLALLFEAA